MGRCRLKADGGRRLGSPDAGCGDRELGLTLKETAGRTPCTLNKTIGACLDSGSRWSGSCEGCEGTRQSFLSVIACHGFLPSSSRSWPQTSVHVEPTFLSSVLCLIQSVPFDLSRPQYVRFHDSSECLYVIPPPSPIPPLS